VLALHSQPVRTAQSGALRNPVLTPLKERERKPPELFSFI
jgi:hypothetical protein